MINRQWNLLKCVQVGVILVVVFIGIKYLLGQRLVPGTKTDVHSNGLAIYTFSEGMWKPNISVCNTNILDALKSKDYFQRGSVKTEYGIVTVYINNPKEDFISKDVHEKHIWEPHVFNTIYKHIRSDPDISFIDVGANLGVFSLQLANLGRKVISIEASFQTLRHLCASIAANGFAEKITIIHNALSSNHLDVPFILPSKGEFALSMVEQGDIRERTGNKFGAEVFSKHTIPVKSTTLDDLLTLPEYRSLKKVFMKMDIQGYEHNALAAANTFFKQGKLTGFYIEWYWHANKPSGDFILKKMSEWGFEPFDCNSVLGEEYADLDQPCPKLKVENSGLWPVDVLWLPK